MKTGDKVQLLDTPHIRTVERVMNLGRVLLTEAINGRWTFDVEDLKVISEAPVAGNPPGNGNA